MFCRPRLLKCYSHLNKICRTFLSDEFKCTSEWQSRLQVPFMQKVNPDNLYYDIEQSFQQQGKASAIDIDIYVNKVAELQDAHTDEIADLLHKLRLTEETTNTLDSTSHAVIRNFLDKGHSEELLQLLDDRLSFGVFLDNYIASYALDNFIIRNDFHSAARIAAFLMLQEDVDNPIANILSLYACYRYLEKSQPFYIPKEENNEEEKEVIKVRVKYLRNEFFDDHFDLKDSNHLVGKTMAKMGQKLHSAIGKNFELLGWTLYQKYDKALQTVSAGGKNLYKDVLIKCIEKCPESAENADLDKFKGQINQILSAGELIESNFENEIEKLVTEIVAKNEAIEVEKQKKVYGEWNIVRETKLKEEHERLLRIKRLKEIEKISEEMKKEEQKLWFFENEDKIDLLIDSKKVYYPKRWFGKKKKPRVVDTDYVPPEIIKQRS